MRRPRAALAVALALASLTGCAATTSGAATANEPSGQGDSHYPVTVDNCGEEVVVDATPKRVVLLETAPVTILEQLGVLEDDVVSRAGVFSPEYYSDELNAALEAIPALSDEIDASGHLELSLESVLAQQPDLVLGLPDGITRAGLRDAGAGALVQPSYCPQNAGAVTFDTLYDQITTYGEIFDRSGEAESLIASLRARVDAVEAQTAGGDARTAAVLYPSAGGGPLYAYGTGSMATPQLRSAGFDNVFADTSERVFEVNIEELIARDPDVLILLYQGDDDGILEEVTSLQGAQSMRAVASGDIFTQLFNFTEPPSPLAVDGLEHIVERFGPHE